MRLDHLVIPVFDADAALRFYGETLGLPLVDAFDGDDWGGFPWLMMTFGLADGRHLVLVALRGARQPKDMQDLPNDARHIAFSIGDQADLPAWRGRLEAAGVDCWEEDHGPHRSLYFNDPRGPVDPDAMARAKAWIAG
eukprot:gene10211-10017_t